MATGPLPSDIRSRGLRSARGGIVLAFTVWALLCIPHAWADELADAQSLEKEGKTAEAVTAYEHWLSANKSASDWGTVLLHTADIVASPEDEVTLLATWLPSVTDAPLRHGILRRLAQTDELLGRLDRAQVYYEEASLVPGSRDFRSLLSSASLLLELGLVAKASAQCRAVIQLSDDPALRIESSVLLVQIDAGNGRPQKAGDQIRALLNGPDRQKLTPGDVLRLWRIATDGGMDDLARACLDLLKSRYPASPETALAESRATPYPTPSQYLESVDSLHPEAASGAGQAPSSSGSPDHSRAQAESPVIQVGSYLDRNNATYRLRDLTDAGFHGEIRTADVGGKRYYRVVVLDVPEGRGAQVIARLRQKGFDGFVSRE